MLMVLATALATAVGLAALALRQTQDVGPATQGLAGATAHGAHHIRSTTQGLLQQTLDAGHFLLGDANFW